MQSPSLSLSPPTPEEDEGGPDGLSSGSGSGDLTDTGRGGVVGSRNGADVGVGVVEVLGTNGKGKERGAWNGNGSVLGPAFEGVRNGGAEGNGEADSGEETWVDTDADSEVEGEKQSGG